MSLEDSINKLNNNLVQLILLMSKPEGVATSGAPKPPTIAESIAREKKALDKPKKPTVSEPLDLVTEEDTATITRQLLAARDYKTAAELLASYGVKKSNQLAEEDRARYYADAKTLIAAAKAVA